MTDELKEILSNAEKLIDDCKEFSAELDEMKRCTEFLINEYNTNKRWFREEPGRVTIEDVIKKAFEFGWASKNNFDYNYKNKTNN